MAGPQSPKERSKRKKLKKQYPTNQDEGIDYPSIGKLGREPRLLNRFRLPKTPNYYPGMKRNKKERGA